MKYEFHVGDYVETVAGLIGWVSNVDHNYIMITSNGGIISGPWSIPEEQYHFNRIGQYDFTKPEPKSIERLPVDLVARFEVPDGSYITTKTWDKDGKFVEATYSRELIDKINELVEAVNQLEIKVNGIDLPED